MPALTQNAASDIRASEMGTYGKSRDVLKHQLWDSRYFGTTITNATYFVQQVGAPWNVGVKTINETNMSDSGKLPNGQRMVIKRMGLGLILPIAPDTALAGQLVQSFINIVQCSVFTIKIEGREFDFQIHGRQFLPAVNVVGISTAATVRAAGDYLNNGWADLHPTPITLDYLVGFKVLQEVTPDANNTTRITADFAALNGVYASMQVTLEGTLTRAK